MQIYNIRSLRIFKGVYWERYFLATIPGESIEIDFSRNPTTPSARTAHVNTSLCSRPPVTSLTCFVAQLLL